MLRLIAMCGLVGAAGWPLARRTSIGVWSAAAAAWIIGLAALTPLLGIIGFLGVPLGFPSIAAVIFALLCTSWFSFRNVRSEPAPSVSAEPWSMVLALALYGLDVIKSFVAPFWSWDHFAIWGAKARLLGATRDLRSLADTLHAEYPVGVPLSIHILTGGGVPERFEFRLIHVILLGCLLLLARAIVLRVTRSGFAANISAAFLSLTPLAWDTEALGLADLPLATYAIAAVALSLDDDLAAAVGCGLCLGFLPWTKQEGLPLAILLFGAIAACNRKDPAARGGVAIALALGSLYVTVGTGVSFFEGEWLQRATGRLAQPGPVLGALWPYLISPATLGLWIAVPVAFAVAIVRRERRAIALLGVVIAQLLIYCGVYFASYIDPGEHIRSSFHRIASGLAPLAVVAIAIAIGDSSSRREAET